MHNYTEFIKKWFPYKSGHKFSPPPYDQNIAYSGSAIAHVKTEACLCLLEYEKADKKSFLLWGLFACAIPWLLFLMDETISVGTCIAACTCMALFMTFMATVKGKPEFPVLFHRQRGEVMFLRWNKEKKIVEPSITPWEDVEACFIRKERTMGGMEGQYSSHYVLVIEGKRCESSKPGKSKWICRFFDHTHSDGSGQAAAGEWEAIRRFMDEPPKAHFAAKWGCYQAYAEGMGQLPALPETVVRWQKPIPQSEWRQPPCKLRWYNSYLKALYAKSSDKIYSSDIIEERVPYPGDDAAMRQLAEGILTPVPQNGRSLPSLTVRIGPA